MQRDPTQILVIRFSSIGDIVLTSPVLRCIKKKYPRATIHFLSKGKYKDAFYANPFIDKEIYWEGRKTLKHLNRQKFDLVVDLHKNLRTKRIRLSLAVNNKFPKWVSFNKINLLKFIAVWFKAKKALPKKHIVHRYMEPLEKIGIPFDNKGLDYFIEKKYRVDIAAQFNGVLPYEYYVYCLGGQHNTKKLPYEKQVELVNKLVPNHIGKIILLGGKEDWEDGQKLVNANKNCINACGKFRLQESASVVEQSRKVITHDTGLMHIAAALLKPIISIWGNTIPEFGMYPFYPINFHDYENRILQVRVYCRPCSKIGFKKCPHGHFNCMRTQNFNEI
jgi:ADP-heptose:LPS heptosyltransferase